MMGETVTFHLRVEGAPDAMGDPTVTWEAMEVAGCLVRPVTSSDEPTEDGRPDAARVLYEVALPKGTDLSRLPHALATLTDRGQSFDPADTAEALRVMGEPDRLRPCPTKWDALAYLGRVHG